MNLNAANNSKLSLEDWICATGAEKMWVQRVPGQGNVYGYRLDRCNSKVVLVMVHNPAKESGPYIWTLYGADVDPMDFVPEDSELKR